ncbi:MAG: nuclear transport factor 2 family protein [Candidatus Hermodarchaeia archaeon]|jgi:ketosteroid isomerase-like protein
MRQIFTFFLVLELILSGQGCNQAGRDIINDPFPEAQVEVKEILKEIYETAQAQDLDQLSSYHLYGPKFTEFKSGKPRADAERNKQSEREFFTRISDFDYDLRDLKVSVFGNVAIATFHGYFQVTMGEEHLSSQLQSTLVFVKTDDSWKIVHEHFSPLDTSEQNQSDQ